MGKWFSFGVVLALVNSIRVASFLGTRSSDGGSESRQDAKRSIDQLI